MSVKQSLNLKRKSKKRKVLPSLPSFWRVKRPGPSLHPPIPSPAMKMLGTDVLPVLSASSARKAIIDELVRNKQKREKGKRRKRKRKSLPFPLSPMSFSSNAVYSTPMSTKTCLAFLQKGHVVKLNITTFEPSIID